jgi:hypothetical protein
VALQQPQAQDHRLVRRKALQQGVSGNAEAFGGWLFALGGGEGVEIRAFAWAESVEALMPQRMNAFLVLAARHPHQAAVIAQIVLQGSLDTRLEERGRMKPCLEAGSGADQLIAGQVAGVIEFDQIGETPLKAAGQGIGQRQELPDNRIAAGV